MVPLLNSVGGEKKLNSLFCSLFQTEIGADTDLSVWWKGRRVFFSFSSPHFVCLTTAVKIKVSCYKNDTLN